MEHLLLKAATTATDEGVFEAVISTATIDRELDIVEPKAMVDALQKWVPTGKKVPLRWNHGTKPEHIIGNIDPASARVVDNEVVVDGWIDQKAQLGSDGWRLVKSGVLGFSFGYLITAGEHRKGGGRHITGMDVFEVTATHAPMNGDTRVLGWKSARETLDSELQEVKGRLEKVEKALEDQESRKAEVTDQEPQARSVDPLRKHALDLAQEVRQGGVSTHEAPPKLEEPEPSHSEMDAAALRKHSRELMLEILRGVPSE
jgi:HK97 family phage prohead protease